MIMPFFRSGFLLGLGAIGLSAVVPGLADGQAEPVSCAESRSALETGNPRKPDLETLAGCPASGPKAIARLWPSKRITGETELAALVRTSVSLPDGHLYGSVAATAADASQPTGVRLAALQVLTAYYQADLRPSLAYLKSPKAKDYDFASIARTTHPVVRSAATPLPKSRIVEIPALLARLAHGDPDPVVKGAALHLRQDLAQFDPKNTPVDANKITLKAGCGPRVSLQSTEDIPLDLRVRVLGTSFDRTYTLNKSWDGTPKRLPLALPPGTVVVTYAGREMARLIERNAPCPPGMTRG